MNEEAFIDIVVVPRASHTSVVGYENKVLRIRIASPPVDGAANTELAKYLSKLLNIAKSHIEIISGHGSRHKRVRIVSLSADQIDAVLSGIS